MDHGVQLDHVARELDARSNHDRRRRVIGEKRQRCLQDYAQIRQVLRRFVVIVMRVLVCGLKYEMRK